MVDDDPFSDPAVIEALKRIGSKTATAALCPGCVRRDLPDGADWCEVCAKERRLTSKRDWWARQGDYRWLLSQGHRPREAAARWLAHRLRKGPVPAADVRQDASRQGIAPKTLRRAREQLQAESRLVVDRGGRLGRGRSQWRSTATAEREGSS
jgi:hypothetical protein